MKKEKKVRVTLRRVREFCEDAFPPGKMGHWTSMGASSFDEEWRVLMNAIFPPQKGLRRSFVLSRIVLVHPHLMIVGSDLRVARARKYVSLAAEFVGEMVFGDVEADVESAIRNVAEGNFTYSAVETPLNSLRKIRTMAGARLIADQLSVSYNRPWGLKHFALAHPSATQH